MMNMFIFECSSTTDLDCVAKNTAAGMQFWNWSIPVVLP
jgi:hypothetical protein